MASLLYCVRFEREGPEEGDDGAVIRSLHEAAFGRSEEADLVDNLRAEGVVLASLVAELENQLVGHILFSRMKIETPRGSVEAAALAPVSVLPEHQGRGVGGQLIRHGLDALRGDAVRGLSERIVLVLGAPHYYSRFGFSSDRASALQHPFPPGALMALELVPDALSGIQGRVQYASSFGIR
jgi:putative acetyltransferase